MKTSFKFLFTTTILVLSLLSPSCKKNTSGGKAEVHVHVTHQGLPIYHANAYVKFGSSTAPANPTKDYDLMAHGEETDNHVHVEGLRPGTYYLTAVGVNTLTGKTVQGGTSVEIKWKDRKNTLDLEIATVE